MVSRPEARQADSAAPVRAVRDRPGRPVSGPDSRGDGDGWIRCARGHKHWGLFGAAGLLLQRPGPSESPASVEVLLQHRALWSHHGGTWGLLGGARQGDETAVVAALREAGEEGGLSAASVDVHGRYDETHGGWAYTTVLGLTDRGTEARPTGGESLDVAWVPVDSATDLDLHPGFAAAWPRLREVLAPVVVVVDAANVVGSRPDGWWRDRAGANHRLVEECLRRAAEGVAGADLPAALGRETLRRVWPRWVVVVEGAARSVAAGSGSGAGSGLGSGHVNVVAAPGSGDVAIVDAARTALAGILRPAVRVVTADRELRSRVEELGAVTVGPRFLA